MTGNESLDSMVTYAAKMLPTADEPLEASVAALQARLNSWKGLTGMGDITITPADWFAGLSKLNLHAPDPPTQRYFYWYGLRWALWKGGLRGGNAAKLAEVFAVVASQHSDAQERAQAATDIVVLTS